jgi:hypothetical protein
MMLISFTLLWQGICLLLHAKALRLKDACSHVDVLQNLQLHKRTGKSLEIKYCLATF